MRLEWLEDILAVIDTGSFSDAAARRCVTQSAFSRRIRMIEAYVGTDLFDRTRKPVQLNAATKGHEDRLRDLARALRQLGHDLGLGERAAQNRIVIASQHAITTSIAPALVLTLMQDAGLHIRLRSANRDECYALLMTRAADLALLYRTRTDTLPGPADVFDTRDIGTETLIPVAAPGLAQTIRTAAATTATTAAAPPADIPLIAYPRDVFLGEVFARDIAPALQPGLLLNARVETALTLAALQLAEAGAGLAWVPLSLCAPALKSGRLADLSDQLPPTALTLQAIRLRGPKTPAETRAWAAVAPPAGASPAG